MRSTFHHTTVPNPVRRRWLRLLAATPLLGACGGPSVLRQAGLQPLPPDGLPAELPAPALRVGDEWRYVMRDAMTGLASDRARLRVTSADTGGYGLAESSQSVGPFDARYDRNLNLLRSRNVAYEPAYPRFAFPLAIGRAWSAEVRSVTVPAARYGTLQQRVRATVRGWERVTVPAGTFVALRVDLAIDWRDTDSASTWGNSAETFWYAPEVRNAVFHHRTDFPQGRFESNNSVTELESYRVGV
jgi:hypothetical protein